MSSTHNKKNTVKKAKKRSQAIPMIALLAALGVSSLTYTVTVQADSTTMASTSTKTVGMHMKKGKGIKGNHAHASSTMAGIPKEKPAAAGIIQSITGSVVTVKDREDAVYTIDVSGAVIMKGGRGQASTTIAASDLKVGDMLGAKGTLQGTHVVATHAMTSPQHPFMKKIHSMLKEKKITVK